MEYTSYIFSILASIATVLSLFATIYTIQTRKLILKNNLNITKQFGVSNTSYQASGNIINKYWIQIEELDKRLSDIERDILKKADENSFVSSIMF